MQPASVPSSAIYIQPSIALLGKTPQILKTLLAGTPGELGENVKQ